MAVVIPLPGHPLTPNKLVVETDRKQLAKFIKAELDPILSKSMAARNLPQLKPSTVERKRRAGYANPNQALVATGALERSLRITVGVDGDITVDIDGKARWLPYWADKIIDQKELERAIDRAIKKWLDQAIKLK